MNIIIHHSEIALKGKNAKMFEDKLISNIKQAFLRKNIKVKLEKDNKRILCSIENGKEEHVDIVKKIFGVKYFGICKIVERDIDSILKKCSDIIKEYKKQGIKRMAIKTKRADKKFPLTSLDVNKKIGEIANKNSIKIDFSNYEKAIYLEITAKNVYIYTEKIRANGGLPVSTSGKILCLLSGGIDSPVAAWLAMKRGCRVDFLHFHTYRKNEEVLKTKIVEQVKIMNQYQGNSKLFLIPYHKYQLSTLEKIRQGIDVVLFRNFMLKTALRLAKKYDYRAILTGDSIGQVASQTLANLRAASFDVDHLMIQPLVTYTKQEIIDLAKKIETYESSIKQYKDCCSIISRKPETHVSVNMVKAALTNFDMDAVIKDSLALLSVEKVD